MFRRSDFGERRKSTTAEKIMRGWAEPPLLCDSLVNDQYREAAVAGSNAHDDS
jgi:hypothetical protein